MNLNNTKNNNSFGGSIRSDNETDFTIFGIPFDGKSSYRTGASDGPEAIRKSSSSQSISSFTETGIDLAVDTTVSDAGDITYRGDYELFRSDIETFVSNILKRRSLPVALGGDHSITYPLVKGMLSEYKTLNIVWLDAHPDIYPEYEGDRFSHACPLARILELPGVNTTVISGIRATSNSLNKELQKSRVQVINSAQFEETSGLFLDGPTYLSIDIDVLDPAYAPGVGNPVPGGISTRDLINAIHSFRFPIVGFDLVEVNPHYDTSMITSCAGAKIVMETIAHIVRSKKNL